MLRRGIEKELERSGGFREFTFKMGGRILSLATLLRTRELAGQFTLKVISI
jgi:hypothetical protein